MEATTNHEKFDALLMGSGFFDDPHGLLATIRDEAPVFRSEALHGWLVSRFADVDRALRDTSSFSNAEKMKQYMELQSPELRSLTGPLVNLFDGNSLSMQDPPNHTRLRRVVMKAFLPTRISRLRVSIEEKAADLLDQCGSSEGTDLITAVADPLPRQVLIDFLGVDREDAATFASWSNSVVKFLIEPHASLSSVEEGLQAFAEMSVYVEDQVDRRTKRNTNDDVIGILAAARETDGFTQEEIIATCVQIIFAGSGTTSGMLGNAVFALLDTPGAYQALREDPDLAPAAVEESLRFEPPVSFVFRVATRDIEVGGGLIPKGDTVVLNLAGANRDPLEFHDPNGFQLGRKSKRHLGFGIGAHLCAGASLARIQGDVVLRTLAARFPYLDFTERPDWKRSFELRELENLPVSWNS
jgi:pimeloyl-[acyl-carrier protein] synthase